MRFGTACGKSVRCTYPSNVCKHSVTGFIAQKMSFYPFHCCDAVLQLSPVLLTKTTLEEINFIYKCCFFIYDNRFLKSSYPKARISCCVPSDFCSTIDGSGIPLNVLVFTIVYNAISSNTSSSPSFSG